MNLLGKAFKVVNWVLFGKGRTLLDIAEHVVESAEIKVEKDGVVIRFKKEI